MLSRVADSLYWMSRYFERAGHCARVLEANYNLMLNPSKLSTDQRWLRVTSCLGFGTDCSDLDPQTAITRLTGEAQNRSSIVGAIRTEPLCRIESHQPLHEILGFVRDLEIVIVPFDMARKDILKHLFRRLLVERWDPVQEFVCDHTKCPLRLMISTMPIR